MFVVFIDMNCHAYKQAQTQRECVMSCHSGSQSRAQSWHSATWKMGHKKDGHIVGGRNILSAEVGEGFHSVQSHVLLLSLSKASDRLLIGKKLRQISL